MKFWGSREAALFNLDTSMAADGSGLEMGNIGQVGNGMDPEMTKVWDGI